MSFGLFSLVGEMSCLSQGFRVCFFFLSFQKFGYDVSWYGFFGFISLDLLSVLNL